MEFLKPIQEVMKEPNKFFMKLPKRTDFSQAFRFYLIVALILNIFSAAYLAVYLQANPTVFPISIPQGPLVAILYIVLMIWAVVAIFIAAGIIHLFFLIVGAKGTFKDTFNAMIYSSIPNYVLSPILYLLSISILFATANNSAIQVIVFALLQVLLSICLIIWLIIIQLNAFSIVHSISKLRAATALYFIPLAIFIIIMILVVVLFAASFGSLMAASAI